MNAKKKSNFEDLKLGRFKITTKIIFSTIDRTVFYELNWCDTSLYTPAQPNNAPIILIINYFETNNNSKTNNCLQSLLNRIRTTGVLMMLITTHDVWERNAMPMIDLVGFYTTPPVCRSQTVDQSTLCFSFSFSFSFVFISFFSFYFINSDCYFFLLYSLLCLVPFLSEVSASLKEDRHTVCAMYGLQHHYVCCIYNTNL